MFYYVLLIDSMYATYVITPKTMKKYYGFIFIELNVGFSFFFFFGFFSSTFMQMKRRISIRA